MPLMVSKKPTMIPTIPKAVVTKREPLWAGPGGDGPNGGITFSLLTKFLTCRERFRVRVIEGLRPPDRFNHRMEYGSMWHACEEATAHGGATAQNWRAHLGLYVKGLHRKYPTSRADIDHWYAVCLIQYPIYLDYWAKHKATRKTTPLYSEQKFDILYTLPSGRDVRLRGKMDSVDLEGKGDNAGVVLQENKTKGDIDEQAIKTQTTDDLQTMLYLTALHEAAKDKTFNLPAPIRGIRYNVVRRPLSGGRGNIKQHAPTKKNPSGESLDHYYDRLKSIIDGSGEDAPGPDYFFARWDVTVLPGDVVRFRRQTLDPILEGLCRWYDWVSIGGVDGLYGYANQGIHWKHPFGAENSVAEYGASEVDEYLNTGSTVGLGRADTLFRELQ